VQSYKNINIKNDPNIKSKMNPFINDHEQRYRDLILSILRNASNIFDASFSHK